MYKSFLCICRFGACGFNYMQVLNPQWRLDISSWTQLEVCSLHLIASDMLLRPLTLGTCLYLSVWLIDWVFLCTCVCMRCTPAYILHISY